MHDLLNDLAQFLAGLTHLRVDDKLVRVEPYEVSGEARLVSFISSGYGDLRKFKVSNAARYLRTLLPIREKSLDSSYFRDFFPLNGKFYLSSMVLRDFPKLRYLRVLSFCGYYISELPKSIGDINHLRYLDFSRTDITELPESVSNLYNLQTLLLDGCSKLVRLPTSIQKLINLRHLDIVDTPSLKEMPSGIGMLTYLRTLSKFIVDKSNGRNITELKRLHHLQGTLSISNIENVTRVQDAVEANLLGKEGLHGLVMKWSSCSRDTREGLQFDVLDALKPQKGLASLEIEFYGGQHFPGWVGDLSFSDMVKVSLIGCKGCAYLPPLGQLPSLRELFIEGMDAVKVVGPEVFGTGSPHKSVFQSLIDLSFIDMDCWEEWTVDSAYIDEHFKEAFPCLKKLTILRCRKLIKLSLPKIPSLGSLEIISCGEVVLRSISGISSLENLEVGDISGLCKLDEGIVQYLGKVESLTVSKCNEMRYLWEEVACRVLEKMKILSVKGCEQLESFGDEDQVLPHNLELLMLENCNNLEKMPNWQNNITSLRHLSIFRCKKLLNLPSRTDLQAETEIHGAMTMAQSSSSGGKTGEYEFSNLESVRIYRCPCLKWFPTGKKLPTTLRYLDVLFSENMEEPEEGEKGMSLLESINFNRWSKLKSLTEGLAHLTRLEICDCEGIKSIPESSLPPTLISLVISRCENLKYMSCDSQMQSLMSLQELEITWCENLERYPSGGRWPPNLESLTIGDVKQPIVEWGLTRLPASLLNLSFFGKFPQLVSFSEVAIQLPTTTSLARLKIFFLENLESLNNGLENLSSLQHLYVNSCPKLRELPVTLLPMLSSLEMQFCPLLKERCKKEKIDYWPSISYIPCVKIDRKLIWGL